MARRYRSTAGRRHPSYKKRSYSGNNKNTKKIAIIACAAVLLVAVVCAVVFGYVIPHGKAIKSVYIQTKPEKTSYYVTDKADFMGLEVGVLSNNGNYMVVGMDECEIKGFDSSKPNDRQYITVSYQGFTTGFYVQIKPLPTINPILEKIEISTLPKVNYKVGEALDTTGGVLTLHYKDGTTYLVALTNRLVSGFDSSKPGTYKLTVKYTENGVLCETNYTITVR